MKAKRIAFTKTTLSTNNNPGSSFTRNAIVLTTEGELMSYQPFTELPENATQQMSRRRPSTTPAHFQAESHSPALQLQRMLGNQRVGELIQAKRLTPEGGIIGLQPKLPWAADDQYEREADHVARQVMSMPESAAANPMQRATPPGEEDKDKMLQTKPLAASITPFVQRQMESNDEPEEKETPIQAKFLNGTGNTPLQRQSATDEDEM